MENYLVGMYVYSIYQEQVGDIVINGSIENFYHVLGWHIEQSYPEVYNKILLTL